jgi:oligoribonuclease
MEWLLWVDIETTGLDVDACVVLQIACVLSNFELSVQYNLPELTIGCTQDLLDNMDEWCLHHHKKSGLYERALESDLSIREAEQQIVSLLNLNVGLNDKTYLAGNSIHFDRRFIDRYLPVLSKRLSYQMVDVTAIGLVCKHAQPNVYANKPHKTFAHTAAADIHESMSEYKYYMARLFSK